MSKSVYTYDYCGYCSVTKLVEIEGKMLEEYTTYYPSGKISKHGYLRIRQDDDTRGFHDWSHRREGEHKSWTESGQIQEHSWYQNGKLEGESKTWWNNGNLRMRGFYQNGIQQGKYLTFQEDGQLYEDQQYYNGRLVGVSKTYHDGRLVYCIIYREHGIHTLIRYNSLGYPIRCSRYCSNIQEGQQKWYEGPYAYRSSDSTNSSGITNLNDPGYSNLAHLYYINGVVKASLTFRKVLSLLRAKYLLGKMLRRNIRKSFLDKFIIEDLGDIVMLYYFKT
jgi:antitoxin component YwqK of YwqJK toxin-antitoxin module